METSASFEARYAPLSYPTAGFRWAPTPVGRWEQVWEQVEPSMAENYVLPHGNKLDESTT